MKKVIGLAALAVISTAAQAEMQMPTIYGKVSKNYMHVSQESKFNRKSTPGVVDTDNSESRLGAKGSYDLGNDMTAKYTLELGLNSAKENDGTGTSGRIRMRLAKVDLATKFGTLTLGQDYTADSAAMLQIDTFSGSVASGVGGDYAAYVEGTNSGIGFLYRSRKDLVKYATPVFAGVQYAISVDKNDKRSNDPASTNYDATYTTHLLSFDKKMDAMTLRLQTSMTHWAQAATGDNSNLHFGTVLGFGNLTFKAGWSKEENKSVGGVSTATDETTRMTAGLTYKMAAHTAKVAYYKAEEDAKRGATTTTEEDSQISFGYEYGFNKYVSLNTIVSLLDHKETTTANNNDATVVSMGAVVKF
ncbi:porin [Halobacteriovorax marinus]|uniref:porin n=1 Tax=Halobacteriovorax marinus TaxID=97084 RepID=UPI003A8EA853